MGCHGCELWLAGGQLVAEVIQQLRSRGGWSADQCQPQLGSVFQGLSPSQIYSRRVELAAQIVGEKSGMLFDLVVDAIRRKAKCYAGLLGTMRAGHAGYADQFEVPKCFPGRVATAARWGWPTDKENLAKPWLGGLPRLIFLSDMGDTLSHNVSFDYLKTEIIDNTNSETGRRHIWLWLSKRPTRMAEFGAWLHQQGIIWPDNLVAMTTVTSPSKSSRLDALRHVPAKLKGLSLEPLFGPLNLNLAGIDWVIVGGGSDVLAEPFHVEWALELRDRCRASGTAFFLKQLGRNAWFQNLPYALVDEHGGDWNEWPEEWRVRQVPQAFCELKGRASAPNPYSSS